MVHPLRSAHVYILAVLSLGFACAATSPASAQERDDRLYRSATGLLNRGMYELAAQEYREFLSTHPDDPVAPTARYALGVCLSRLGRHADACEQLKSVASRPDFEFGEDATLLLGQSELLAGKPTEAASTLARLVKEKPQGKQADTAMALLGESQMRAGDPEKAMASFKALAEKWPRSPMRARSELMWATCESQLGRHRDAAERLGAIRGRIADKPQADHAALLEAQCRQRIGDTARARELFAQVAKDGGPEVSASASLGLAQIARASGQPREADAMLRRLLEVSAASDLHTSARVELARCMLDVGDAGGALAQLERITDPSPALADDAAYWSARALAMLGKHAEAAARLESCDTRFEKSELLPQMTYERAEALSRAGDAAGADALMASLREKFPGNSLVADSLLASATAAYQSEDFAKTMRLCNEFLAAHGDHPHAATASLLLAECAFRKGAYEDAEAAYSLFLQRHPDDAQAWSARVRLGLCLARLGKREAADKLLEECVRDTAGDPQLRLAAHLTLADGAFAAGEWKKAESWLTQATSGPSEALEGSLLKLGLCAHRQGRPADALAAYDRLLREFPRGDHRIQATFERGQALMDLGRDDEAIECLTAVAAQEGAARTSHFSTHAKRHLAALAMRNGRAADAAALLSEIHPEERDTAGEARLHLDRGVALLAAGDLATAERELRLAAEGAGALPTGVEARANLAITLSRQDRLEDSLAIMDEIGASLDSLNDPTTESLRYERVTVLRRLGREKDAMDACRAYHKAHPKGRLASYAWLEEAQLHASAGRDKDVIRTATAARQAAVDDAQRKEIADHTAYLLGLAHQRRGEHADAIRALTPLIEQRSGSRYRVPGALLCGEAMVQVGRHTDAAALFEEVANTESGEEIAGAALLRLGEARAAMEQWVASERAFRDFLTRFPDSPLWFQARFGIAWAAEHQGRHDSAMQEYGQVVARHEGATAARAQFQIGECLYAMKRYDDAVKQLLRVDILYAYPEWSAAALYEAGRCLAEQGKVTEANARFDEVITRFADSRWATLAKEAASRTQHTPPPGQSAPVSTRKDKSR